MAEPMSLEDQKKMILPFLQVLLEPAAAGAHAVFMHALMLPVRRRGRKRYKPWTGRSRTTAASMRCSR
jgi:hypothetical protein